MQWLADSCLNCENCRMGSEATCALAQCHGYTVDGSFQRYAVSYAKHVTPIPEGLPLEVAAPVLCAGVTVWKAIKEVSSQHFPLLLAADMLLSLGSQNLTTHSIVGQLQAGRLARYLRCRWRSRYAFFAPLSTLRLAAHLFNLAGHLAVQYANAIGLRVVGIDTGSEKEKLLSQYGAEGFIDFKKFSKEGELIKEVKRVCGGEGPHVSGTIYPRTKRDRCGIDAGLFRSRRRLSLRPAGLLTTMRSNTFARTEPSSRSVSRPTRTSRPTSSGPSSRVSASSVPVSRCSSSYCRQRRLTHRMPPQT